MSGERKEYGTKKGRCFIPGCEVSTEMGKLLVTVPTQKDRRQRWFEASMLTKMVSTPLFCCEDHFDLENDSQNWQYYKTMGKKLVLKPEVAPHLNLRSPMKNRQRRSQQSDSVKKRKIQLIESLGKSKHLEKVCELVHDEPSRRKRHRKQILFTIADPDYVTAESTEEHETLAVSLPESPYTSHISEMRGTPKQHCTVSQPAEGLVRVEDTTCPSTSSKLIRKPRRDVSSDTSVSQCTEVAEEELSDSIKEVLSNVNLSTGSSQAISLTTQDPRFFLGLPKAEFRVIQMASDVLNISARDIMLTIRKIRLNDSNKRIAYDFNLSTGHVSRLFSKTVQQLSSLFQQLIFWPPASTIKKLMPIAFRHRFNNVQSILDCFEIEINKPSKPKDQALTWSEYKKCNTVKVLISCTPYGFINFLSKSYGGRISDKTIVQKSGFMNVVPSGTAVLADRGFKQLEGELGRKQVTLIRPASVKASTKPTKAEVRESRRVAATRIHVERVISRIREFRFLGPHSRIDKKLVRLVDHCIVVAAAIINLQEPIIKQ